MEATVDVELDDILVEPAFFPISSLVEVIVGIDGTTADGPEAAGAHELVLADFESRPGIRVDTPRGFGRAIAFRDGDVLRVETDEIVGDAFDLEVDADLDVVEVDETVRTKTDLEGVGSVVRAEDTKFAIEFFDPSGSATVEVRGKLRAIAVSSDVISHE